MKANIPREYRELMKKKVKEHELKVYETLYNGIRPLEYDDNGEIKISLKRRFLKKIIKFLESKMA